uniref:Bone morphogenetic protein Bmp2a n=1 Tax=Nemertoderma westbladi TaxID=172109 RepID=A0A2P1DVE3_9BILA|nr:bone morphogenetic protein Bmp2a [Nemertoderma westbladi]
MGKNKYSVNSSTKCFSLNQMMRLLLLALLTLHFESLFAFDESPPPSDHTYRTDPVTKAKLESMLLGMFGFTAPPPASLKRLVPTHMRDLYHKHVTSRKSEDLEPWEKLYFHHDQATDVPPNTIRSFLPEDTESVPSDDGRHSLRFSLDSHPKSDQPVAAELRLFHEATPENKQHKLRVNIYDVINHKVGIHNLIDTKIVNSTAEHTVVFDILPAVQRWLKDSNSNSSIVVEIKRLGKPAEADKTESDVIKSRVRVRRSTEEDHKQYHENKSPLVVVYSHDKSHADSDSTAEWRNRVKRRSGSQRKNRRRMKPPKSCRRDNMKVSFEDVGWMSWIVAPDEYDAFYCYGACSFPMESHLQATNHAVIQSLVNTYYPTRLPKPCCVATEISSICLLYTDESGHVNLRNYKEMTVDSCGCA